MSASTAGALKTLLEAQGLGISVYRDAAPPMADGSPRDLPYLTIDEGIAITPDPAFSAFDDPQGHVIETAQVNIWQAWRDPVSRAIAESYTLADAVVLALRGARLATAPTPVPGMTVRSVLRLLEPPDAPTVVHTAITVDIRRQLSRTGA